MSTVSSDVTYSELVAKRPSISPRSYTRPTWRFVSENKSSHGVNPGKPFIKSAGIYLPCSWRRATHLCPGTPWSDLKAFPLRFDKVWSPGLINRHRPQWEPRCGACASPSWFLLTSSRRTIRCTRRRRAGMPRTDPRRRRLTASCVLRTKRI